MANAASFSGRLPSTSGRPASTAHCSVLPSRILAGPVSTFYFHPSQRLRDSRLSLVFPRAVAAPYALPEIGVRFPFQVLCLRCFPGSHELLDLNRWLVEPTSCPSMFCGTLGYLLRSFRDCRGFFQHWCNSEAVVLWLLARVLRGYFEECCWSRLSHIICNICCNCHFVAGAMHAGATHGG